MKNLVLIGGGNQAHYTIDIVEKEGKYNIVGIIDSVHDIGSEVFGYKVIGRQDDIVNIISLVAQPIIMNTPVQVSLSGVAPTLTGNGYAFKFAVEHGQVFERGGDNVSILKEIFFGTTIDGVILAPANVEFVMSDIL